MDKIPGTPGRASRGLSTLINNDIKPILLDKTKRWLIFKLSLDGLVIISISVYFKPDLDLNKTLEALQQTLNLICYSHTYEVIIIGGDLNVRMASLGSLDYSIIGTILLNEFRISQDHEVNKRDSFLLKFMSGNGMVLLNGWSPSDSPGSYTFLNKLGKSTTHLIWINLLGVNLVDDMWVAPLVTTLDHLSVTVVLRLPTCCVNTEIQAAPQHILRWRTESTESYKDNLLAFFHGILKLEVYL